jgi:nucleoid DNA-binding protein
LDDDVIKPLTRADLVNDLRERVGLSARDASGILDAALRIVADVIAAGGQVNLPELGRFMAKPTPARSGRNPKTGQYATVPAKIRPCLRASRSLREAMLAKRDGTTDERATPAPGALEDSGAP